MSVSLDQFAIIDLYSGNSQGVVKFFGAKEESTTFGKYDIETQTTVIDQTFSGRTFKTADRSWYYSPQTNTLVVKSSLKLEFGPLTIKEDYTYTWGKAEPIKTSNVLNPLISLKEENIYGLTSSMGNLVISAGSTLIKIDRETRKLLETKQIDKNSQSITLIEEGKLAVHQGSKVNIIDI